MSQLGLCGSELAFSREMLQETKEQRGGESPVDEVDEIMISSSSSTCVFSIFLVHNQLEGILD